MQDIIRRCRRISRVLPLLLCMLLSACGRPGSAAAAVRVVVEDHPAFTAEQPILSVEKGADAVIPLTIEPGYLLLGCNYADYTLRETEPGRTELVLHGVRYPLRLKLEAAATEASLCYYANGGTFADGGGAYRLVPVSTEFHRRVNVSIGIDLLSRDGYTQIGWNTAPDGTGEHIGLGSRVTPEPDGVVSLYAEWVQWTDPTQFVCEENSSGVTITDFTGSMPQDVFSVPACLEGKPVNRIAAGAIKNLEAPCLVLPHTVHVIEDGAFSGKPIRELYFSDTLVSVKDSSFPGPVHTVHINAAVPPKYQGSNANVQFAENLDNLIMSRGQKKLIFFAGCSMCFGLRSDLMAEAFPEYTILDMGVIGSTVASVQLECISRFVEPGDILIHAPEEQSRYQLMDLMEGEPRTFLMLEGNYDLLSYADVSGIENFFGSYCSYNAGRAQLPDGSYNDRLTCYNSYGDYIVERPLQEEDVSWHTNDTYDPSYINDASVSRLVQCYDLFRERGAEVLFSFAPHNYNSLSGSCIAGKLWQTYEARLREALEHSGFRVISKAEDYIYSGKYFYDTDYHLNDPGAILRTKQLIRDLEKAL